MKVPVMVINYFPYDGVKMTCWSTICPCRIAKRKRIEFSAGRLQLM